MRKVVLVLSLSVPFINGNVGDSRIEIGAIAELPLVDGIDQWESLIKRLLTHYPEEQSYLDNALITVKAVADADASLRDADKNIVVHVANNSAQRAALGALRESVESTIKKLEFRGMKRSLKPEDRRILMVKALYKRLLERIKSVN